MWRAVLLVAALVVSASAQPVTRPSQVAATKPTAAKSTAKTPATTRSATSKTATKKTAPAKRHKRVAAAKKRKLKTLKRVTVEQQSAQLASVGRVSYRGDMPPGFEWPATTVMMDTERGCEAELDAGKVDWQHADALGKIADPIAVPAMVFGGIAFHSKWEKAPFVMDCQLARMLVRLGPKLAALGVKDVTFGSVYRNTLVRFGGVTGKALSRHALGFAMDIVSFTDKAGRVVVVESDYPKKDALLLAIEELVDHDKDWRILLTPRNDPISHKDHYHLEASIDFR